MKDLKIYFTSDMHGYFSPIDYGTNKKIQSGMINCASEYLKKENTLIIDGGDTLQGSPFTYYLHKNGDLEPSIGAKLMNLAGYDYITLGNHDFNYGQKVLNEYLSALDAKCLCCNVKGVKNVYEYDIIEKNGLKIGLTGAVTHFVNLWEKKENLVGIEIKEPLEDLKRIEKIFEENKVDLKICIYHGGFEKDVDTGVLLSDTKENQAYEICESLSYDILLTGHQHIGIENKKVINTYTCQTPDKARQYIEMDVDLKNKLDVTSKLVNPGTYLKKEMLDYVEPYEEECSKWLDVPVGFLDEKLEPKDKLDMAINGSYIANFFNQVQLASSGADISGTSLANEVKGFEKEVTIRDVVATYIYPNTLETLVVDRATLKKGLEKSAEYFEIEDGKLKIADSFLKPKVAHYMYDFISGIDVTFDITRKIGDRVTSIIYKGKELDDNTKLTYCMNNYRAGGTGGYEFYLDCPKAKSQPTEIAEMIMDYISTNKNITVDKKNYVKVIY